MAGEFGFWLDSGVGARAFGKYWLPVLIWMGLIFLISTDLGSVRRTSRIIGPFLRFFWPAVTDEQIRTTQLLVRKSGHVGGYAVLAGLLWRARRRGVFVAEWEWRAARFALAGAALYAVTDEIHQSLVPSRMGSAWDVLIDAAGAALGLAVIWALGRQRKVW